MPKSSRQSIKAMLSDRVEDFWLKEEFQARYVPEYEIEVRLRVFGLDPHEVELIMLRYVENKTMKGIVKEQGWLDLNSANYYLRKTLAKLRKGRFSLR